METAADLKLEERLDFDGRTDFMAAAVEALDSCGSRLSIDCSHLSTVDDIGVALLLGLSRYASTLTVQVELRDAPTFLQRAIEERGFGYMFFWNPLLPWRATLSPPFA